MAKTGLSDEDLLKRLSGLYSKAFVAGVAKELADARKAANDGTGSEMGAAEIHAQQSDR